MVMAVQKNSFPTKWHAYTSNPGMFLVIIIIIITIDDRYLTLSEDIWLFVWYYQWAILWQ